MACQNLQLAAAGSSRKEARHAPTPPKAGPTEYVGGLNTKLLITFYAAHAGPVRIEDSKSVEWSQGSAFAPAALKRDGEQAQLSALARDARASRERRPAGAPLLPVRLTDGVAPVAQPGSAPHPELPVAEVARSNRAGGSPSKHMEALAAARVSEQHTGSVAADTAALPVAGARRKAA